MHTEGRAERAVLLGTGWALTGKVFAVVLAFATNVFLARQLPASSLGAYFLTQSIVMIAALIAQLGLNQAVVKMIAELLGRSNEGEIRKVLRIAFSWTAIGASLVGAIIYFGLGSWLSSHVFASSVMGSVVGLTAIWVFVAAFQSLFAEVFRGFHDIRAASLIGGQGGLGGLVTLAISLVALAATSYIIPALNVGYVIALNVGSTAAGILIAALMLRPRIRSLRSSTSVVTETTVMRLAMPLLVNNMMIFIIAQSDIWIVGAFLGAESVAIYGVAAMLVKYVASANLLINAVMPPIVASMYSQARYAELEKLLRRTATVAGLPAVAVLALFAGVASEVLATLYGPSFSAGAVILVVLSIGQLVNVWTGSASVVLAMTGHETTLMRISLATGVISAGLVALAAKYFGIVGVAVASALGLILMNVLMLVAVKRYTNMWTHMGSIKEVSLHVAEKIGGFRAMLLRR